MQPLFGPPLRPCEQNACAGEFAGHLLSKSGWPGKLQLAGAGPGSPPACWRSGALASGVAAYGYPDVNGARMPCAPRGARRAQLPGP